MEELSRDPEIANDLFQYLSTKLKDVKSALHAAEEENKDLRKRLDQPQAGDMLSVAACRIGQCRSRDDVERLSNQLKTKDEQLAAANRTILAKDKLILKLEAQHARVEAKAKASRSTLDAAEDQLQIPQASSNEVRHSLLTNDFTVIDTVQDRSALTADIVPHEADQMTLELEEERVVDGIVLEEYPKSNEDSEGRKENFQIAWTRVWKARRPRLIFDFGASCDGVTSNSDG